MPRIHAIASKENPVLKGLRARLSEGSHALIPGPKLIEAFLHAKPSRLAPVQWIRMQGETHALERRLSLPALEVPEARMRELTEQPSPPPLALEVEIREPAPTPSADLVLGLWAMQDPGNLGAVMRVAAAFGFSELRLGPGCAHPFSLKALRGAMGATFLLDVRPSAGPEPGDWILDGGPHAVPLAAADFQRPLRLWVGSEGRGWKDAPLPGGVRALSIPIQGVESLNAAVAAGIACHEIRRRLG